MQTTLGSPTLSAVLFFVVIVILTLAITWWAAKRTKSTSEFYAAGRSISAFQNGLALAGDYMSAASFLGIAGLVAMRGYDGMIYATGWLVGWPALMFFIAEPLRNLGKFTFAVVVAFRLQQRPVRIAAAFGGILTLLFYTIAQMVGAGNLVTLMFGIRYEWAGEAKDLKDTGTEVWFVFILAILTKRVEQLTDHFRSHAKDYHSRLGLIKMVGKRRRLLDYLKRKDFERYQRIIARLGIRK